MPPSKEDRHTIAFLKMAATELRRIAERAPDIETDLRHVVQQIETEIADMEQRVGKTDTAQPVSDSLSRVSRNRRRQFQTESLPGEPPFSRQPESA
jgi:anti-sigma-K factor RskA